MGTVPMSFSCDSRTIASQCTVHACKVCGISRWLHLQLMQPSMIHLCMVLANCAAASRHALHNTQCAHCAMIEQLPSRNLVA